MRETLQDNGCLFRAVVEDDWNSDSCHGDYIAGSSTDHGSNYPSYGQCGVTTKLYGDHLREHFERVRFINGVQDGIRQGRFSADELYDYTDNHPAIQLFRAATKGLEMSWHWYAFGEVRKEDTDELITDDHAWLWSVDVLSGEGYDSDLTADQLSTPEMDVPPVTVQATGKADGQPFYHVAREILLVNGMKASEGFNRRIGNLSKWLMPYYSPNLQDPQVQRWELYWTQPRLARRAQELKRQCFPETPVFDPSKFNVDPRDIRAVYIDKT